MHFMATACWISLLVLAGDVQKSITDAPTGGIMVATIPFTHSLWSLLRTFSASIYEEAFRDQWGKVTKQQT